MPLLGAAVSDTRDGRGRNGMGIRSTSEQQLAAFEAHRLPEFEEVRPGVYAVAFELPNSWLGYSFGYLIQESDSLHLVDVGADSDSNWQALADAVGTLGRRVSDIATVMLTHVHGDHTGLSARLQAAGATTVAMHVADTQALRSGAVRVDRIQFESWLEEWEVPAEQRDLMRDAAKRPVASAPMFEVSTVLNGDEAVKLGARTLRVVHTPGHTTGHIVLIDDDAGIVFTGDHVLPRINTGVGLGGRLLGDDPIGDYLTALERLGEVAEYEVLPGHCYRFSNVGARTRQLREHHLRRARDVEMVIGSLPGVGVWEIASRLQWAMGWENLSGTARFSALCQTSMHVARLRGTQ